MMQIALDFSLRVPVKNRAHSELCKRFFTGAIGEKDKQVASLIYVTILTMKEVQ